MIQSFTLTNFNSGLDGLPYPCCPPPPPPPLPTDSLLNIPPNPPLIPPVEDKSDSKAKSNAEESLSNSASASDLFSASVSELRRKAQEHSAALWQLAQTVQQTQQNDEAKGEDGASGRSSVEEKEQEVDGAGNGKGDEKDAAK